MFIDTNRLDDEFIIIWALHKYPIGKVLSRMEKELEWKSSNVAIKTKLIKQPNQSSGCLLLTLKKKIKQFFKIQVLASWWRAAATIEGRAQTCASVLRMEEMRKKRTAAAFLCCRLITVGYWLEPTVIDPNHCQLFACDLREEEGEDGTSFFVLPFNHYRFLARSNSDSTKSLLVPG